MPAPAGAGPRPWPPGSWALPASGAARTASSWPQATSLEMFEFALYVYDPELTAADKYALEVASSAALDADGTLADANRVDAYDVLPRSGSLGIFTARTRVGDEWLSHPGTYYWQAAYDDWVTPVQTLVISPKPPPDAPAGAAGPAASSPAARRAGLRAAHGPDALWRAHGDPRADPARDAPSSAGAALPLLAAVALRLRLPPVVARRPSSLPRHDADHVDGGGGAHGVHGHARLSAAGAVLPPGDPVAGGLTGR